VGEKFNSYNQMGLQKMINVQPTVIIDLLVKLIQSHIRKMNNMGMSDIDKFIDKFKSSHCRFGLEFLCTTTSNISLYS